jgi:hypothetical protein
MFFQQVQLFVSSVEVTVWWVLGEKIFTAFYKNRVIFVAVYVCCGVEIISFGSDSGSVGAVNPNCGSGFDKIIGH